MRTNKIKTVSKKKYDFFSCTISLLIFFYLAILPAAFRSLADIVEIKMTVLHISMVPALLALAYIIYQLILNNRKPNKAMYFGMAWVAVLCLSTIFASDKAVAMDGIAGWYMGLGTQLCLAVIFVVFSYGDITDYNWDYFLIPGCAIIGIGVLQRFGVHLLYTEGDRFFRDPMNFSTLGGRTWAEYYVVLMYLVSFAVSMYKQTVMAAVTLITSSFALLLLDCSSILIVVAVLFVSFLYLCWNDAPFTESFERLFLSLGGFWLSYAVYRVLALLVLGLPVCGLDTALKAGMIVLCPVTKIIYRTQKKKCRFENSKYGLKARRRVLIVPAVLIGIGILYIALNTMGVLPDAISIPKLVFNDTFMNRRGCWWKASWLAFKNGTLKEKLIGYGPDCWYVGGYKYYGEALKVATGSQKVVCAHNEFLNMFVTTGLLGGSVYAGMFVYGLYKSFKNQDIMVAVSLAAYVAMQFFNYQTVVSAPLGMMVLGLAYRNIRPIHPIVEMMRKEERKNLYKDMLEEDF